MEVPGLHNKRRSCLFLGEVLDHCLVVSNENLEVREKKRGNPKELLTSQEFEI